MIFLKGSQFYQKIFVNFFELLEFLGSYIHLFFLIRRLFFILFLDNHFIFLQHHFLFHHLHTLWWLTFSWFLLFNMLLQLLNAIYFRRIFYFTFKLLSANSSFFYNRNQIEVTLLEINILLVFLLFMLLHFRFKLIFLCFISTNLSWKFMSCNLISLMWKSSFLIWMLQLLCNLLDVILKIA